MVALFEETRDSTPVTYDFNSFSQTAQVLQQMTTVSCLYSNLCQCPLFVALVISILTIQPQFMYISTVIICDVQYSCSFLHFASLHAQHCTYSITSHMAQHATTHHCVLLCHALSALRGSIQNYLEFINSIPELEREL